MSPVKASRKKFDISVYIIGRNCRDTLAEALDSVYAQSVPVTQIIYLDDGSADDSPSIAVRYVDRGLVLLRNEKSLGIPASRNRAVSACTGEWIAVLDADDRWRTDKIERQTAWLAAHPAVGLLGSFATIIDADAREFGIIAAPVTNEEIKRKELLQNCFVHSSVIFRRELYEGVGGYASLPSAQDYDLMLKLSEQTEAANLPEPLVDYRVGDAATSVASRKKQMECTCKARDAAYRRRSLLPAPKARLTIFLHRIFLSFTLFNPAIHWGAHQMILGDPAHGRRLLRAASQAGLRSRVIARVLLMIPDGGYRIVARAGGRE